jgi:hypothetical protein
MRFVSGLFLWAAIVAAWPCAIGQSIQSGTVTGTVADASGAVVPGARVELKSAVTGYAEATLTDATGSYRFNNVPRNQYVVEASAKGFAELKQPVEVKSGVPVVVPLTLNVAGSSTALDVHADANLVESDPTAHQDVDRSALQKLPVLDSAAGLSTAITYSTGAVAADANGFFHPLGDHAQVSFVIDGQPISDQQSKVFSTQLPMSAVQGMEVITGMPMAEFGDKSSMIAQVTTRSGLGAGRWFGNEESSYGSFGTASESIGLGYGNNKVGNFLALDGTRSGRFLDSPEFTAFHDKGNNATIFDRFDWQPDGADVFHLNLFLARNWIEIPNTYDQLAQDQRQRVLTWNIAPGYQHTFNSHTLLTLNPYIRTDQFNYYASRDPFADTPATQGQSRRLMNYGLRGDLSLISGRHDIKIGIDLKQTRLLERFSFGLTDPTFNPVCVNGASSSAGPIGATDPNACPGLGLSANPNLVLGLVPYDLTRGGSLFQFDGRHNINQYAVYLQDSIRLGNLTLNAGLRADAYYGMTSGTALEPRVGLAYNMKRTSTVLRAAYSRTFETPFNENLILSSSVGGLAGNVFGSTGVAALRPGLRNQYNAGLQQGLGRWMVVDADYFWKYTDNAYDFGTLLNTTITFPIAWKQSKIDGVSARVSTVDLHGFRAYFTLGHNRARYLPPEDGGLLTPNPPGVFRIDHDQALQSTLNLRYQRQKNAEWVSFIWRYDSGQVVSGVPDAAEAMALTPNQQATIGLACNGTFATVANPITACGGTVTSKLLTLPQTSQENDDHNPDRVKPRNLLDVGVGTDNLLHAEGRRRILLSLTVANLTNQVALYNFLSTFSGTHFVEPRSLRASVGFSF